MMLPLALQEGGEDEYCYYVRICMALFGLPMEPVLREEGVRER